nr:glycosyltransferase family 4 protein [Haloarcula sp. CBA1122]
MNTHLRTQWHTLCITILLKALRVPVVRTVHERTEQRLGNIHSLSATVANWHFRLADHLIVHTETLRRELFRDGITTPTSVIRHGNYCFFRKYINDTDSSPYNDTNRPVVLFFGVKEHKGIEIFLNALNYAETKFEPWVVGPINDGDEKYAERARNTDGVETHFEFIPDRALARYFQHADIVALPYKEGTTSGALQLSLAFESAVITSALPCFTEYITSGETGIILEKTTPEEFACRLDELVAQPAYRQRLASGGFELANSKQFDWNYIAGQLIDIYSVRAPEQFGR